MIPEGKTLRSKRGIQLLFEILEAESSLVSRDGIPGIEGDPVI